MRISDWSSDVCSSDLQGAAPVGHSADLFQRAQGMASGKMLPIELLATRDFNDRIAGERVNDTDAYRSEEHTSELQSLMRISYAVFCLKKKTTKINKKQTI